ncbi:hypothetical protein [Micromonospora lupini]|uniref:Uncharacterized protein n=1 Tax=Micromonospora lupini str. Lupac 08 TaxID=1150864 RepID=I0LBL8_9ACTN|nr:hypothetical protein [Micromonospora lupini]CCH21215.1 Protein of unknown function [Micromonospora lupini str. Lupac 08]
MREHATQHRGYGAAQTDPEHAVGVLHHREKFPADAKRMPEEPGHSVAKTHIANIQAKLALNNRVGIAAWAWRAGLARAVRSARGRERVVERW